MNKELYKKKTKMIKALANPTRLLIVDLLATGEKNVSEIIELGVIKTPGIAVDGVVKMSGKLPSIEEIKELL